MLLSYTLESVVWARRTVYRVLLVAGEVAAFLLLHLLGMPPLLKYLCVVFPFFLAAPALFSG